MIANIVLFGWIPVVLLLFATLKPRTAVAVASVGAWLFLPIHGINVQGLPPFDKFTATSYGLLLGVLLFDARSVIQFRPHILDVPAIVLFCVPFATSISNGLGPDDGLSTMLGMFLTFGVPYFMGRLYFCDPEGMRLLAKAILIGGLIYVPLCLFEVRFSPQLHRLVYGTHQHSFAQTYRLGGYRPDVFMQHGLMVALWMACASLAGVWALLAKAEKHIWKIPIAVVAIALISTTLICKSIGAMALLAFGVAALMVMKHTRLRLFLLLVVLAIPAYVVARVGGNWDGQGLVDIAEVFAGERADSLQYRLDNEELLKEKAMQRPLVGWGLWNRSRVEDVDTTTDSLWIIMLGRHGVVGLAACFGMLLLPAAAMIINAKRKRLVMPFEHPVVLLMMIVIVFSLDSVVNAMVNPVYLIAVGAVMGGSLALTAVPSRSRRRRLGYEATSSQRLRATPESAGPT